VPLAAAACALAVLVLAPAARPSPVAIYVVRPDPRLCPSPLCGGYWVARANHARTRCHDALHRPRCYVATLSGSRRSLADGALARGVLGSAAVEGFGPLGALRVDEAWEPVTGAPATGEFFRLRDTGVRCIRAPCFWIRASRLNTASSTTISDLGLGLLTPRQARPAVAQLTTSSGLLAAGHIVRTPDGGRLVRVSQVYLRAARPRA
jgi:hypothetical protein